MKTEKDLFDEIGNVLHAHEDAYVPGAWEEFVKTKKRRRGIVFIRIAAAAAILLFLGYAAWLFVPATPVNTESHQTKNTTKPPYIYPESKPGHDSLISERAVVPKGGGNNLTQSTAPVTTKQPFATESLISDKGVERQLPVVNKTAKTGEPTNPANTVEIEVLNKDAVAAVTTAQPSNNINAPAVTTGVPPAIAPEVASVVKTAPNRYERGTQRLSYDSLANLNKAKPATADSKKSRSLSYALLVSPSVGNQKMNFGTGVEVAYNINKNFSVSSGVTYAYVNAGSSRNPAPLDATQNLSMQGFSASYSSASAASASSFSKTNTTQSVQGVKLALSGLEIPLSFQYKTPGGFYVSAGVSAMSVIGNNLSYNYISNRSVSTPSANGLASTISVITEETTQRSTESLSGYIGFYTFSAGKKLNFGKGKLNFAPFIKVPFSRVSSESIQLIHGGVQLGIGF